MAFLVSRPSALVVAAMGVALLLTAGGACSGRTACFTYTQGEFIANNGCPAPADALKDFRDPTCPGAVVSVDGPGTFDGELCCYAVTYDDITPDCPKNGAGGQSSAGTGPPPLQGGVGGSFSMGGMSCEPTCKGFLATGNMPCGGGIAIADASNLLMCAAGSCATDCQGFVSGAPLGTEVPCLPCLQMNCVGPLSNCETG
jgi:hypothetical protein